MVYVALYPPVGLDQDPVDRVDTDASFLCSDGFYHTGEAEVSRLSQDPVAASDNKGQAVFGESVMGQADGIQFPEDKGFHIIGIQFGQDCGIGDPGLYVVVDPQGHVVQQFRLAHQDDVMIFGKIRKEQPEFSQGLHIHQVSIVDDEDEGFADIVQVVRFLDEPFFAFER